jgi:hypothetical protein
MTVARTVPTTTRGTRAPSRAKALAPKDAALPTTADWFALRDRQRHLSLLLRRPESWLPEGRRTVSCHDAIAARRFAWSEESRSPLLRSVKVSR